MPRYSEELINSIIEANDIVDVIGGYVRLVRKGTSYFGLCPFHGEKTPSFSVSPQKQIYYCFGCGKGGNVLHFLCEYENISFTEALSQLAQRAGIALPEGGSGYDEKNANYKKQLYAINKEAAYFYYNLLRSKDGSLGYSYFKDTRKLLDRTITHFGLGYADKQNGRLYEHLKSKGFSDELMKDAGLVIFDERRISDRFWNRVMFPIMDVQNRVVGFGGRVMGEGQPKYLNSPETPIFDKSSTLYGLNFARKSRKPYFLICEGYMDVIALHEAGFTNAVASLGTAFNEKHARLLKRYTNEVILTQDSDEAGIRAKLRAFPILRAAGLNVKVLSVKGHKDPDEFIRAEGAPAYEALIKSAKNAFLYEIDVLKSQYDLSDPAMKTQFYDETAEKLCMFEEPLERDNYIQAVSHEHMINYEELKRLTEYKFLNSGRKNQERKREEQAVRRTEDSVKRALIEPSSTTKNPFGKAKNASLSSQRLLLSWCSQSDEVLSLVKAALEPSDFSDGAVRSIYESILSISDEKGRASRLMELYTDDEEARKILGNIINSDLGFKLPQEMSREELVKAVSNAVRNIKLASINAQIEACGDDIQRMQELFKLKNELEKQRFKL